MAKSQICEMELIANKDFRLEKLYQWAFGLAIFTIVYNTAEGLLSTCLGY